MKNETITRDTMEAVKENKTKLIVALLVTNTVVALASFAFAGYVFHYSKSQTGALNERVSSNANIVAQLATGTIGLNSSQVMTLIQQNAINENTITVRSFEGTYEIVASAARFANASDTAKGTLSDVWANPTLHQGTCRLNVYDLAGVEYGIHEYDAMPTPSAPTENPIDNLFFVYVELCSAKDDSMTLLKDVNENVAPADLYDKATIVPAIGTFPDQSALCSGRECTFTHYNHYAVCSDASKSCNTFPAGLTWQLKESFTVLYQIAFVPLPL